VRQLPRQLRAALLVSFGALLVALARPPVAHLVLQGLLVAILVALVAGIVSALLRDVEPERGANRLGVNPPNPLPRELAMLADELRTQRGRSREIPQSVLRQLRSAFQHRLWYRHGLSFAVESDQADISRRVSPEALAVLTSGQVERQNPRIPLASLPALIQEVEQL
jgi:hypothetical protein